MHTIANDLDAAIDAVRCRRDGEEPTARGRRALTALHTGLIRADEALTSVARSSDQIETLTTIAPELALAARGLAGLIQPHGQAIRELLEFAEPLPNRTTTMADVAEFVSHAAQKVGDVVSTDEPDVVADFLAAVASGLRHPDDLRRDEETALTGVLGAFAGTVRGLCQIAAILDNADVIATLTRTARNLSAACHEYVLPHLRVLGAVLSGEDAGTKDVVALERLLVFSRGIIDVALKA